MHPTFALSLAHIMELLLIVVGHVVCRGHWAVRTTHYIFSGTEMIGILIERILS